MARGKREEERCCDDLVGAIPPWLPQKALLRRRQLTRKNLMVKWGKHFFESVEYNLRPFFLTTFRLHSSTCLAFTLFVTP
jgi:hypothetical protein